MEISKKIFLGSFCVVVVLLAVVRCVFPEIAEDTTSDITYSASSRIDSLDDVSVNGAIGDNEVRGKNLNSRFFNGNGTVAKNRIYSVPNYRNAFPDENDIQLEAAKKHGVQPVKDRDDAENRKVDLVYVAANPYFHVDKLHSSIPYLVPQASILLQDIGKAFFDSLQIKDIPLSKIIVTSALRSMADVEKLQERNGNAKPNSCHLYGTTFDICYNRYLPVGRKVQNDTLKWVLSEVLNDFRKNNRCYVKYEVNQGCFHITTR